MKNICIVFLLLSSYVLCAQNEESIYLVRCAKEQIVEALKKNPKILKLEIARLTEEEVDEVVEAIKANKSLEDLTLDLSGEFAVADEFSKALEALAQHRALKKLTIRFGTMNDKLALGLKIFSSIEEINFSDLTIHKYQTNDLAQFLQQNPLKKLTISKCTIHGTGGKPLIAALKNHLFLQEIILVQNGAKIEINELCDGLKCIKNLRQVRFEGGRLDEKQLGFLADGITNEIPFTSLGIYDCPTEEGFLSFVVSLKKCTWLHTLHVNGKLGQKGMHELLLCVGSMANLKNLSLAGNNLSRKKSAVLEHLVRFIEKNSTVASLDLSLCRLNDDGMNKVLDALEKNRHITQMKIDGNNYCAQGSDLKEVERKKRRLERYLQRNTILSMPKEEFLKYHQVLEILCCAIDIPTELIEKLCRMVMIFSVE